MRGLLLTSAAALVSLSGGVTSTWAQGATSPMPPSNSEGVIAAPLPIQSANNSNNRSAAAQPNGLPNPTPGSVVIHINGRVETAAVVEGSSLNSFGGAPGVPAAKIDPFSLQGFARLYAGVDGMATNGLRYGASMEIRQDFGPAVGSTANSGGSANSFSSTLFVRRAFTYVA